MKDKSNIIIASIIFFIIITIGCVIFFRNVKNNEIINEGYITQGMFYQMFIKDMNISSIKYSDDELDTAKDLIVYADVMVERKLINKEQAKKYNDFLTKELLAQVLVNYYDFDIFYGEAVINDIDACYDKDAIKDSVIMKIFELDENNNFNPNSYVTNDDIDEALLKMYDFEKDFKQIEIEPSIDLSNIKLSILNTNYDNPWVSVQTYLDDGWTFTNPLEGNIINKRVRDIYNEIQDAYNSGSTFVIGFNAIYLEKDDFNLCIYFDLNNLDILVSDALVYSVELYVKENSSSANALVFGIKMGDTLKRRNFVNMFGSKNYNIYKDSNRVRYSKLIEYDDYRIELQITTDDNNKVNGLYLYKS